MVFRLWLYVAVTCYHVDVKGGLKAESIVDKTDNSLYELINAGRKLNETLTSDGVYTDIQQNILQSYSSEKLPEQLDDAEVTISISLLPEFDIKVPNHF